jgi:hypothetical protein
MGGVGVVGDRAVAIDVVAPVAAVVAEAQWFGSSKSRSCSQIVCPSRASSALWRLNGAMPCSFGRLSITKRCTNRAWLAGRRASVLDKSLYHPASMCSEVWQGTLP